MKNFILETVLLFSFVALAANYISNLDKPPRVKQILNIEKKLDIINLGTSHGNDFRYSALLLRGGTFNRAGNTLYYDLQNYKFLKEHLNDSAIILLPISYFSFGTDENRGDRGEDNPFVNDFYEYLPMKSIYSYSAKRDISLKVNRIQKNFRNLFPKEEKEKKTKKASKKTNSKKKIVVFDTIAQAKMLKEFAIKRVVHHKKIGSFIPPEKNIGYLKNLMTDAKKSGYRPVLITVPYYKEYAERFGADWLAENYYAHITQLSQEFKVPYLDYGFDQRFSTAPELWQNSDHLNRKGIVAFNKILFADLIKQGLIAEDDIRHKKK